MILFPVSFVRGLVRPILHVCFFLVILIWYYILPYVRHPSLLMLSFFVVGLINSLIYKRLYVSF